jgi:cytochrome b
MVLAEQKRTQNVAEYIIFMWQMEDLMRAIYFDDEALDEFIRGYVPNEEAFAAEKKWFRDLIRKMKSEKIEQRGHLSELHELVFELNFLHNTLHNVLKDKVYIEHYRNAQPHITEYLSRSDGKSTNDIETCLVALYGLLVLRLKKTTISEETEAAMATFSQLLARLAHHYRQMKNGEVNFSLN